MCRRRFCGRLSHTQNCAQTSQIRRPVANVVRVMLTEAERDYAIVNAEGKEFSLVTRFASLIHWVRVMAHQAERALTMGRIDRLGEQR